MTAEEWVAKHQAKKEKEARQWTINVIKSKLLHDRSRESLEALAKRYEYDDIREAQRQLFVEWEKTRKKN